MLQINVLNIHHLFVIISIQQLEIMDKCISEAMQLKKYIDIHIIEIDICKIH